MFTARLGASAPWPLPLALLLAACGGPEAAVRGCTLDADCGPGALCVQSACVTNRPPAVSLQLPASPTTNRVLFLSATATDPDPGDAVTGFTWTVTPVGAACPAEPEPGSGPQLELVFWCAGTYEVAVVAEDRQGGRSAPARQVVEVALASGAPVVTAGPTVSVDHACGGTPFACRPALAGSPIPLALSGAVTDPSGGALGLRWRMIPPVGVDPGVSVTYAQGSGSLSTQAWVETPGGLLAGTWRFRLRATSAAGLVGQADQLVQIGNRPPVLAGRVFQLDHRYEAGGYLAGGTLPLPASDPDGDPVALTVSLVELGTQGCVSRLGPVIAGSVAYDTRCDDPARLIGLGTRSLRVIAADGSGAVAEASFPIEIANRPPELRLASNPAGAQVSVDHRVGPCPAGGGSCFLAEGTATFEVVDPDGDPVASPSVAALSPAGLGSSTGEATTAGGLVTFRFATALSAPGEFRSSDGVSPFSLLATAADPFGATGTLGVPIVIGNRPPVLKRLGPTVAVQHRYDPVTGAYLATAPLSAFEDPDGDPLLTVGSQGHGPCSSFSFTGGEGRVDCRLPYRPAPGLPPLATLVGDHPVVLRAFDGWEASAAGTVVNVQNGAPTATPWSGVVQACSCECARVTADSPECLEWKWRLDPRAIEVPVIAADADGDPVQVTYTPAAITGPQRTVFPAACSPTISNPGTPLAVEVTIDDGVSLVQVTSLLEGIACSSVGTRCTP